MNLCSYMNYGKKVLILSLSLMVYGCVISTWLAREMRVFYCASSSPSYFPYYHIKGGSHAMKQIPLCRAYSNAPLKLTKAIVFLFFACHISNHHSAWGFNKSTDLLLFSWCFVRLEIKTLLLDPPGFPSCESMG